MIAKENTRKVVETPGKEIRSRRGKTSKKTNSATIYKIKSKKSGDKSKITKRKTKSSKKSKSSKKRKKSMKTKRSNKMKSSKKTKTTKKSKGQKKIDTVLKVQIPGEVFLSDPFYARYKLEGNNPSLVKAFLVTGSRILMSLDQELVLNPFLISIKKLCNVPVNQLKSLGYIFTIFFLFTIFCNNNNNSNI